MSVYSDFCHNSEWLLNNTKFAQSSVWRNKLSDKAKEVQLSCIALFTAEGFSILHHSIVVLHKHWTESCMKLCCLALQITYSGPMTLHSFINLDLKADLQNLLQLDWFLHPAQSCNVTNEIIINLKLGFPTGWLPYACTAQYNQQQWWYQLSMLLVHPSHSAETDSAASGDLVYPSL